MGTEEKYYTEKYKYLLWQYVLHLKFIIWVVNKCSRDTLNISNLVIIFLKSKLLQFPMYSIHNFSLKTYHLKCLKRVSNALVNNPYNTCQV